MRGGIPQPVELQLLTQAGEYEPLLVFPAGTLVRLIEADPQEAARLLALHSSPELHVMACACLRQAQIDGETNPHLIAAAIWLSTMFNLDVPD